MISLKDTLKMRLVFWYFTFLDWTLPFITPHLVLSHLFIFVLNSLLYYR